MEGRSVSQSETKIEVGDVVAVPQGVDRKIEEVVIQAIHHYDNGSASITYRSASNPHGISWRGFIREEDMPSVVILDHTNERLDVRSMLPGG